MNLLEGMTSKQQFSRTTLFSSVGLCKWSQIGTSVMIASLESVLGEVGKKDACSALQIRGGTEDNSKIIFLISP